MFDIEDRVRSVVDNPDRNKHIHIGSTGTVVNIDEAGIGIIGVCWDDFVGGHTCHGNAEDGYGWNVHEYEIELEDLNADPKFDIDESVFMDLFK